MTDKELRRLTRSDLLEILLETEEENESLREENEALRAKLEERKLALGRAGSIAEASLSLNGVFEAAQAAADQYIENIKRLCAEKEEMLRSADDLVEKAKQRAQMIEDDTVERCRKMVEQARTEADLFWRNTHDRLRETPPAETGSDLFE